MFGHQSYHIQNKSRKILFSLLSPESDEALYELAHELPAISLPHMDGGIPLSAFPKGTTSELAGLLYTTL